MNLVSIAVLAQVGPEGVGGGDGGDRFGGEESGGAPLPVLVLALNLAFSLGRGSVAEGDPVEVPGGTELG